jgi:hypothetical protein
MQLIELTRNDLDRCVGGEGPSVSAMTAKGTIASSLAAAAALLKKGLRNLSTDEEAALTGHIGTAHTASTQLGEIDDVARGMIGRFRDTDRLRKK